MIASVVIGSVLIFLLGYYGYGRFLSKAMGLDNSRLTPACQVNDGVDFVPAKPGFLLGQHFSAIAAAGPIVGPILSGLWFGWLPTLLWIILGAIFVGGVHDFSSLVASIRHKAASIGEIVKCHMSKTAYILFLIFVWIALTYVIIAFTDITASTFKTVVDGSAFGPAVAASSILYLLAAVLMGILLYKFKLKLWIATSVFLPLVLFIVWLGPRLPHPLLSFLGALTVKQWDVLILAYCFAASVIPMWLLLQPRGYLGGWLLYLVIAIGFVGALFGGFVIQYPAFNTEGLRSLANGRFVFPLLFITVACGACSGFHGIVSSGTTSKQLLRETDAMPVGYGAMLLEGVVAVLALTTVMIASKGSAILQSDPNLIYADGIARYLNLAGVGFSVAFPFALLVFSTFVYDTLDVCTRLARYVLQELTGWKSRIGGYAAALASLVIPFVFLVFTKEKAYLIAWPIFGTSNQLLASLTLLAVAVWLIKSGKRPVYIILPMFFMLGMTLWSLINLIVPFLVSLPSLFQGAAVKPDVILSGICGVILLLLSLMLLGESVRALILKPKSSFN